MKLKMLEMNIYLVGSEFCSSLSCHVMQINLTYSNAIISQISGCARGMCSNE